MIFLISLIPSILFTEEHREVSCFSCSLEDNIPINNKRFRTFFHAFKLMKKRNAKVLVETGTARSGRRCCIGDGCSTIVFSEWAAQNNAFLYSVDLCKNHLIEAEKSLGNLKEFVELVHSDSIEFLKNFNQPIDFLYLDSYDFEFNNPTPSQEHHLKEIIAAYPWLTESSIVMIDDCQLPYGGKGKLVIEYLLKKNWRITANGYQVVLVQGD